MLSDARIIFSWLTISFHFGFGLICYQNDENTGELYEVENEDFVYCRYFPARNNSCAESNRVEKADGLLQDESSDEPFEKFFKENDHFYKVLSVCIYEKYDFKKMATRIRSPKFKRAVRMEIEHQFRCICNFDRCNSRASFEPYFKKN